MDGVLNVLHSCSILTIYGQTNKSVNTDLVIVVFLSPLCLPAEEMWGKPRGIQ